MGFYGKTLDYGFYFPYKLTPDDGSDFDVGPFTVGDGAEVSGTFYTIDVVENVIRFQFTDTGIFSWASFNGAIFRDAAGALNQMSGFWLQTNMSGFNRDDVALTADELALDFANAAFTPKTYISLTILFSETPVVGSRMADILVGTSGADKIRGLGGDDVMRGEAAPAATAERSVSAGARSIDGDRDRFVGGAGSDSFVFATGDTARKRGAADTIMDFDAASETIDLREWDADRHAPDHQAFTFIGAHAFSGEAGELRYAVAKGNTYVEGDTDGDGRADFSIRLLDAGPLTAANFLL